MRTILFVLSVFLSGYLAASDKVEFCSEAGEPEINMSSSMAISMGLDKKGLCLYSVLEELIEHANSNGAELSFVQFKDDLEKLIKHIYEIRNNNGYCNSGGCGSRELYYFKNYEIQILEDTVKHLENLAQLNKLKHDALIQK